MGRRLAAIALAFALGACGSDFHGAPGASGVGGASTTISTSSTSDSAGGGSAACAFCAEVAPDGWSGPVIRRLGDDAASGCIGGGVIDHGNRIDAAAASCGCTCDVACGKPKVTSYGGIPANCAAPAQSTEELPYECKPGNLAFPIGTSFFRATSAPLDECPAHASKTVAPPTTGALVALCQAKLANGLCEAGACLDPSVLGDSGAACVFKKGPAECPASYPKRESMVHALSEVADTRGCSACTCGKPSQPSTCGGVLHGYFSGDCSGNATPASLVVNGDCAILWPALAQSLHADLSGPTCTPSGGAPTGTADVTNDGLTVCCR